MINWHRLFGIFLTDYFTHTPYTVELEKDLSLQQQFLDVVILRKNQEEFHGVLPDGLENLKQHNLLSYKSMHESFDRWALHELIGHYVNYRKQLTSKTLRPESEFSLYAVSTRFPYGLEKQTHFEELKQGVYELDWGMKISLIVLSRIKQVEHNALWHLFSSVLENIDYGKQHYHTQTNPSSVINLLYETYQLEGLSMPYTLEEFQKEVAQNHLQFLSSKERLEGLSAHEIVKQFPTKEVIKQFPTKEILKQLTKEEIIAYLQELDQGKMS